MKLIKILILTMITTLTEAQDNFNYLLEQFADLKIMRYQVPGFEKLSLQQKKLIYYLSQAALCGRDIIYDQNCKYNLSVRRTCESILDTYRGNRETDDFRAFQVYIKRVWFSNGIHHHYSMDKFFPACSKEYFASLIKNSDFYSMPIWEGEDVNDFTARLCKYIFDADFMPKRVSQDATQDLVLHSSCNFYEGVTQQEVEAFYKAQKLPDDPQPISYGLNTKVIKIDGQIKEITWKTDEMYSSAIWKIVYWLDQAVWVAENENQKKVIQTLIQYYETGNLKTFDEYNISWVKDFSQVDFVNGFIEVYGDPLGMKATWESVVNFKNMEASKRTETISANAQWFEDHSPVSRKFRKKKVKGVSAKVITVAQLGGDCYPATPIGINLPNADWIRKMYGSKSVTLENITYAYEQASLKTGLLDEFAADEAEIKLIRTYGAAMNNLHTDLHECLGHGSGQMKKGITAEMLKNYHSTLEEARADLFALYYIMDPKMLKLGLVPSQDAPKAEYMAYIRNGLMTQLVRIEPGKDVMEAHMRNRLLIAKWCYENGKKDNVIEFFKRDGKTYIRINDFEKLRELFGKLLKEVQRIKSEGDYEAGKELVETYAVKVDPALHNEVLERYRKLNVAPYGGFINPELIAIESNGEITDVKINYPDNYSEQMMNYSRIYSFLPDFN